MMRSKEHPAVQPGVFGSIRIGFDLATRYWWLIILPLLLDVLYWIGPRLRVEVLFDGMIERALLAAGSQATTLDPTALAEATAGVNLVTLLAIPLWGLPAVMGGATPAVVPIPTAAFEVTDWSRFVLFYLLLTAVGVVISSLYYTLVGQVVRDGTVNARAVVRDVLPNALRLGLLLITVLLVILLMLFPIALVAMVAGVLGTALVLVVLVSGSILIMWTVILVTFSLHAIFLDRLTPVAALTTGVRFLQRQVGVAVPLLLVIFVINSVGENLWRRADNGSWLTIVSLAGHAFIATALVLATFVFYRDRIATLAPVGGAADTSKEK